MKGDIPLVKTQLPVIVMKRPEKFPTAQIKESIQENNSLAFVLNKQHLNLIRTVAIQTTCSGLLCDRQRIGDWSGTRGCGCFSMLSYRSSIALEHTVFLEGPNKKKIVHSNFSSLRFSQLYLSGFLPANVKVSALQNDDCFWDMEDQIEKVVDFINTNGGWTAIGWYKRGEIKDRSLLDSTANNGQNSNNVDENVGSGKINYHIVQLMPTDVRILDSTTSLGRELDSLKYDVSQIRHL